MNVDELFDRAGVDTPVVAMKFGSDLYGMRTADSDTDYAGIYLPTRKNWVLNRFPQSIIESSGGQNKNTPDDVDIKLLSLPRFVNLACAGDISAIDMLHCRSTMCSSWIWIKMQDMRTKFYSKNMSAYTRYLRDQVHKYGVAGSRINDLEMMYDILRELPDNMERVWEAIPTICYDNEKTGFKHTKVSIRLDRQKSYVEVVGKKYMFNSRLDDMQSSVTKSLRELGKRAELARENKGIDWKSVHHALRVQSQQLSIFKRGDFTYPLWDTGFLLDVKEGKLDFSNVVQPLIESQQEQIEQAVEKSDLPDEPDREFWDSWLCEIFETLPRR